MIDNCLPCWFVQVLLTVLPAIVLIWALAQICRGRK